MGYMLLIGALVRWCAMLPAIAVLIAPRWIGVEEFGLAATVMALPFLVQGLCEPVILMSCIDDLTAERDFRRLASIRDEIGAVAVIFAVVTIVFALEHLTGKSQSNSLMCGLMAAAFLLLATLTTWVIGLSYATRSHQLMIRSYAAAGVMQVIVMACLPRCGAAAMLLSQLAGQCAYLAVSVSSPTIRSNLHQLFSARRQPGLRPDYVSALCQRAPYLLLNTGTVLLTGLLAVPSQVAALRLSVGLAGVINSICPISPQLLQSTIAASSGASAKSAKKMLMYAFAVFCALSAGLWWHSRQILHFLLSEADYAGFDGKIFLAVPFFLLIQPVGAYLFAVGRRGCMIGAAGSCGVAFAAGAALQKPEWAFCFGAVAYLGAILAVSLWNRSRQTSREFVLADVTGLIRETCHRTLHFDKWHFFRMRSMDQRRSK